MTYAEHALQIFNAGYSPLPLTPGTKEGNLPPGFTGYDGVMAGGANVYTWIEDRPEDNVAARLPINVIGIDVDAYGDKIGAQTLEDKCQANGQLPRTWRVSSRFGDGYDGVSGILLFQIPTELADKAHNRNAGWITGWDNVDLIRFAHRYFVAPGSIHKRGTKYQVLDETTGEYSEQLPDVKDLPMLPPKWCEALLKGDSGRERRDKPESQWWTEGKPCNAVAARLGQSINELETGRHDSCIANLLALTRLGEQGHEGVRSAVDALHGTFIMAVTAPGDGHRTSDQATKEWKGLVAGLDAMIDKTLTPVEDRGCCPLMGSYLTSTSPVEGENAPENSKSRRIILTSAASITPQRVHWLWQDRLALGTLGLLAGREGEGKSTVTSWLIAQITKGLLPGEYFGEPRSVIIAATEDSWAHTIVPRLIAASADLSKVLRVEVVLDEVSHASLSLPNDLPKLKDEALKAGAALMVLDPLTSRLADNLDTHKDSDTRRALEPLVRLADDINMAILGLMHFNKSGKTNPMDAVMASRAFVAVARSVHTVVKDPDDQVRIFATPKNNLGRSDLPMLGFDIVGHCIQTTDGDAWTSKITWGEEREGSVDDLMERSSVPGDRTATQEAADWLEDYLTTQGGKDESAEIKRLGVKAGHSVDAIKRAKGRLGLTTKSVGFPRRTYWSTKPETENEVQLEHSQSNESPSPPTAPTAPTGADSHRGDIFNTTTTPTGENPSQLVQLVQLEQSADTTLALLQLNEVSKSVAS